MGALKKEDLGGTWEEKGRGEAEGTEGAEETYSIINDILRPGIIVDINRDAPQRSYFRREFRKARVVLALAFVGV